MDGSSPLQNPELRIECRKRPATDDQDYSYSNQNSRARLEPESHTQVAKDVYDCFGMYVAAKLRCMEKHQRLCAENVINQALFHGSIQALSSASTVHTSTIHTPQFNQVSVNNYCPSSNNENIKTEQLD